jgi:hypothetical protein
MRGDRRWAQRDPAGGRGDVASGCARPRHVCGRGGPSSLRRAPRLHQVSGRPGLERVLQVGVRQAHDLPPRSRLHARLRQADDPRRHAATPGRLSLSHPVLAKRGRRHLRQPTQVRPPPRSDPLLRHGVGAHPRNAALVHSLACPMGRRLGAVPLVVGEESSIGLRPTTCTTGATVRCPDQEDVAGIEGRGLPVLLADESGSAAFVPAFHKLSIPWSPASAERWLT